MDNANKTITKDKLNNVLVSDFGSQAALKPESDTIFGKLQIGGISDMPTNEEFLEIEKDANNIINKAKEVINNYSKDNDIEKNNIFKVDVNKFNNIETIRDGKSIDILDDALSIIQTGMSNNLTDIDAQGFKVIENQAIKRVLVDNHVKEIMSKTGLAATGNVNVALNSVKMATFATEKNVNDIAFTNFV